MKRKHILAAGVSLGVLLSMSMQVFAAPILQQIVAFIDPGVTFTFDGEEKALTDGYQVITYNNRTYVPARFVAETLGAKVDWDNTKKVVGITTKKADVPNTPGGDNTSTTPEKPKYDYKKLPLYNENSDFKMSVTLFADDDYGRKLNVTLENKTDTPIQLDQMATVVVIDGVKYDMGKASIGNLDTRWYQDIEKDKKIEGYVRLPNNIKEYKDMHVEFSVKSNGYKQTTQTMTFDIDI